MRSHLKENLNSSDESNENIFLKIFNWAINSSIDSEIRLLSDKDVLEVVDSETTTTKYNSTTPDYFETHNADSLSIMWYLASFGALVMFFLLISFSEVCCKKSFSVPQEEVEVSPPPYDLFAPPTYDSLYEVKKEKNQKKKKRRKCEVFVIPMFGDKKTSRVGPLEVEGNSRRGEAASPPPPP